MLTETKRTCVINQTLDQDLKSSYSNSNFIFPLNFIFQIAVFHEIYDTS